MELPRAGRSNLRCPPGWGRIGFARGGGLVPLPLLGSTEYEAKVAEATRPVLLKFTANW